MVDSTIPENVLARLTTGDDPALWAAMWEALVVPINAKAADSTSTRALYLQIGTCSHWLRPHQTRLSVGGGFAWPTGYAGGNQSRQGLPELDWAVLLRWNRIDKCWEAVDRFGEKRRQVCRISMPARSARHRQAVAHVRWEPGTITQPRGKATFYYAFRRGGDGWVCVTQGDLHDHGAA
jgi:hypothetical protein